MEDVNCDLQSIIQFTIIISILTQRALYQIYEKYGKKGSDVIFIIDDVKSIKPSTSFGRSLPPKAGPSLALRATFTSCHLRCARHLLLLIVLLLNDDLMTIVPIAIGRLLNII